jgi:hypothetical protein
MEEADAWLVLRGILAGLAHIHSQVRPTVFINMADYSWVFCPFCSGGAGTHTLTGAACCMLQFSIAVIS